MLKLIVDKCILVITFPRNNYDQARNIFAFFAKMTLSRPLENLGVFVDTVRAGSFSSVARRHGVAVSSIARQIDALERELQVALFTRSTRALRPTESGELLFHRAVRILAEVADARSEVSASEGMVRGVLRISCLPTFGRRYVVPALTKLFESHPALSIELDLTERLSDPTVDRLDAAIRFGQLPDSTLIGSKIGTQRYVLCAAPSYVARYGSLTHISELHVHRLIDKRRSKSPLGWREILDDRRLSLSACVFESDDFEAQRQAAVNAAGIARLPDWVVGHDIGSGALIALYPEGIVQEEPSGIYILRALAKPNARLLAFTAALLESIGAPSTWRRAMEGVAL